MYDMKRVILTGSQPDLERMFAETAVSMAKDDKGINCPVLSRPTAKKN